MTGEYCCDFVCGVAGECDREAFRDCVGCDFEYECEFCAHSSDCQFKEEEIDNMKNPIPEDDKEKRMLVKPLSEDVERYPISDARIMFDSEKQRDEFKALLEKEGEQK